MAKNCCFKGRGRIAVLDYAAAIAKTAGLMSVGNSPQLSVNVNETVERVKDFTTSAGGTECSSREIDYMEVTLQLKCLSLTNLVLGLHGSGEQLATAAIASEPKVAWPGAIVPLSDMPDLSKPITVTNTAAQPVPYAAGTDYVITEAGSIEIPEGSTIPAPTVTAGVGQPNIQVSYQRVDQTRIQLATRPSRPVQLHFDGVNVMDGGGTAHFDLWKVQFGPAANVQMLSADSAMLELKGEVLRDPTKPRGTAANPLSQYGTLRI